MTLQQIWNNLNEQGHGSDKFSVHSYGEVYEEILAPYRTTAKNILEIGIFRGDSIRLWESYFTGKVYGIDCDIKPHGGIADLQPMIDEGTHRIFILDATNESEVQYSRYFMGYPTFDVIIEDAGHDINQQLQLYKVWKKYLSPNGVYVIEDIQDIFASRELLENIDPEKSVTILDRRHIRERYDDTMVIIQ